MTPGPGYSSTAARAVPRGWAPRSGGGKRLASGSEVNLIVEAGTRLAAEGINVRLVSFPSCELFAAQAQEYREAVLPPHIRARLAVEAGVAQGWEKFTGIDGAVLGLDRFGASAPAKVVFEKLGFTVDNVITKARELLK